MKKISLTFFTLIFFYSYSQIEAYYQQQADYNITVDIDVSHYKYHGKQIITYTNNSPDTLTNFYFHLYWNAFQPNSLMDQQLQKLGKGADRRMITTEGSSKISTLNNKEIGYQKIKQLKQDGISVDYLVEGTIAKVKLNKPILPHSKVNFEMEWDAQIPVMIRRAGRNNLEDIKLTMTQWYPKVAEYDYEGWHTFDYIAREFHGVFGNYDVKINIDKDYIIGAGAVLQNPLQVKGYEKTAKPQIKNNKVLWHFTAQNILDFAWAADPNYIIEKIQVPEGPLVYQVYKKSEKTKYWEESKSIIIKYFQIMKEEFGAYPYPTYSFIQGGDGGMEYGMCTMILGNATSLKGFAGLMFHEASHSWFQQIIATNESMRAWMDEGFTSYAESIAMAKIFPEEVKNYPNPNFGAVASYIDFARSGREEPMGLLADHFKTSVAYSNAAYTKGELFLVQLGYIVGQKSLSKIMKEYFQTWKFKHPTDRDFMHIAQKVSQMDLKWYWNYMTYTTRTMDYSIKSVEKIADNKTKITLENLGDFPMPIDIYISYKGNIQEMYNIPLNMMHNIKSQEFNITQRELPSWPWTQKEYSFDIPESIENIKFIMIDATQRMADVNYKNNIYPK